jgi:hypothetical protein
MTSLSWDFLNVSALLHLRLSHGVFHFLRGILDHDSREACTVNSCVTVTLASVRGPAKHPGRVSESV